MQKLEEAVVVNSGRGKADIPLSVIVPVRNEAHNLPRCLQSLARCEEVYVIDSQSSDATQEIAREYGAQLVQFRYQGGWPKKRQWAMDSLTFSSEWLLLLDADEVLPAELLDEIKQAINDPGFDGYQVGLQMYFLGRPLHHCGASFYKLSLFRRGKGSFECRLKDQDSSMCDMEVHEHVVVKGRVGKLNNLLRHHNVGSLARYIQKHNEYSNWEARVWLERNSSSDALAPDLFGEQAQQRRWLRKNFFALPGSPLLFFLYKYVFCLGFLDGIPGLIYCGFQGVQFFHIKAKIYELKVGKG